jgi:DNA-binding transcriptional LysR family regulator
MKKGNYDLIVFSQGTNEQYGELFRTEPVFWVASHGGTALEQDPLPIAGGQHCCWKDNAVEALNRIGRDYRIAYTSSNAIAIASAVLTDLAVGFLPESALQPGMRVIQEDKNLPRLRDAQIALMRASHAYGGIYDALATHIIASMGNLEGKDEPLPVAAE